MDNGYPQILTPEALKLYITQQGVRSELAPFEIRVRRAAALSCGAAAADAHPSRPAARRSDARRSRATRRCR